VKNVAAKFWADASAATAIEYDLIGAGISPAINSTLSATSTSISNSPK
jgi:Flp pilus assembly pilin Flp